MAISLRRTQRGFVVGKFVDQYKDSCSIQESSSATEACIYLGRDDANLYVNDMPVDMPEVKSACRMHLTQEMAKDLLPLLQHFVENGLLPTPDD